MRRALAPVLVLLVACGCSEPDFVDCDGGELVDVDGRLTCASPDGGSPDAGPDAGGGGADDAGLDDAGREDDAGVLDGGEPPPAGDAPDCLDEDACPFVRAHVLDLSASAEQSIEGEIDDADHAIPTGSCGVVTSADRDVLRVEAPVRSIVELVVEPTGARMLAPTIETFDDAALWILTFAEARRGEPARTMWIQPAGPPESMRALIHASEAYESLCDGAPPAFRGGSAYSYRATARRCDTCAIEELGALDAPTSVVATLDAPGGVHVVRLTAPAGSEPEIELGPSDVACPAALGGSCCPIVVPLRPGAADAQRASYTSTVRSVPAQCGADRRVLADTNATGERLFAIYDYEGLGAAGYTVRVHVTP